MNGKRIKAIIKDGALAILLAVLFIALLAHRLFHPR
jgi:uncharacterized MnhB-related membrane protein